MPGPTLLRPPLLQDGEALVLGSRQKRKRLESNMSAFVLASRYHDLGEGLTPR